MSNKTIHLWKQASKFYAAHRLPVWIGAGVLVLVLLVPILYVSASANNDRAAVETKALSRGELTQTIGIVGTVRAVPSASLTWSTSGNVMPYTLKVGDQVKAGDVLLELEPSSLSASVLQAQTQLISARNELAVLQTTDPEYNSAAQSLTDAEVTYNKADADFDALIENEGVSIEMIEPLIDDFYIAREALWAAQDAYQAVETLTTNDQKRIDAQAALDEAQRAYNQAIDTIFNVAGFYFGSEHGSSAEAKYLTYHTAKAALNEARVNWNAARANADDISAAAANVQALQNTIDSSKIIAPFDGTITDTFSPAGQSVISGDSAIQLDNLTTMMLDISVSEVDVNNIQVGDPVSINFDALPGQAYNGLVTQVGNSGIDNSGVIKFNVSITLTDNDGQVKPGFTAVNTIITDQVEDALLIPVSAIQTLAGQKVVVVYRDGSLVVVPVSLGVTSDLYSALVEGDLQEGDLVVVSLSPSAAESLGLE